MEDKRLNNKIEKHLDEMSLPNGISKDEAWKSIQHSIKFENRKNSIVGSNWIKYAASIVLLCTIGIVLYGIKSQVIIESLNDNVAHALPDGSVITLNAHSTIKYNDVLWFLDREVSLSGHAYFDVAEGKLFEVNTTSGIVEVLGTEFIINEHDGIFEVSCFEGSVKVQDKSGAQEVVLSKGLATVLKDNELVSPYNFNQEKYVAWKNGLFFFENQSLTAVFDELEHFYELEIELSSKISDKTSFSGIFNRGELKNSLEIICSSMGLSYEITNNKEVRIY